MDMLHSYYSSVAISNRKLIFKDRPTQRKIGSSLTCGWGVFLLRVFKLLGILLFFSVSLHQRSQISYFFFLIFN